MNFFGNIIAAYWSNYLKPIKTVLTCATTAILLCCCTTEGEAFLGTEVVEGIPVTASLTIGASGKTDITVTKSVTETSYTTINSFALFIFSADGSNLINVCYSEDDENPLTLTETNTTGVYNITFNSSTGRRKLLGIANYSGVTVWTGGYDSEGEEISFDDHITNIITNAKLGKSNFDDVYAEISYLNDNYFTYGVTPSFSSPYMLMSGEADVTISQTTGNRTTVSVTTTNDDSNTMYMYRAAASIVFNISASSYTKTSGNDSGNIVTYTPSTYTIYNIPKGVRFEPNRTKPTSDWTSDDEEGTADFYYDSRSLTVPAAASGYFTFSFFMPENLQADANLNKDITGSTSITYADYATREAWDGTYDETSGQKNWHYAPEYATYVVIHGSYVETDSSGNLVNYSGSASYTIHLGDFSSSNSYNYGDFTVRRNYQYTYNIQVQGVDTVIAEVETSGTDAEEDSSPGAEGNISHITTASLNYVLDAHFEQVLLEYDLTSIAAAAQATINEEGSENCTQAEAIGRNMILHFESPFQDATEELYPYTIYIEAIDGLTDDSAIATAAATAKTTALADVDYKWIEFWPQTGSTIAAYPGVPAWNSSTNTDATSNSAYLLDAYDACVAMGNTVAKIMNGETLTTDTYNDHGIIVTQDGDDYYARFTGFIGEYYYTEDPITGDPITWGDFVNGEARRMIISLDSDTSTDGNSSYSDIHTNVSQYTIQTFYDGDNASSLNGFGIETFNESPRFSSYGTPRNSSYTSSVSDGHANQIGMFNIGSTNLSWTNYISTTGNGWTSSVTAGNGESGRELSSAYVNQYAWLACINRNRDLDGDGYIDEDEIYWYLPSVNEYIIIQLGEQALSNESILYYGDKSEMVNASYPNSYLDDGALYFTSCSGSQRVFWAVERASYGAAGSYYSGSLPVRCARRLPSDLTDYDHTVDDLGTIKTTTDGNYLLDFSNYFESDIYRTSRIATGALVPHNEEDAENKLYKAIVLSKGNTSFSTSTTANTALRNGYVYNTLSNIAYYDEGDNPCSSYYEESDQSDLNAWRPTNLSEMVILSWNYSTLLTYMSNNGTLTCGTQFSNTNVRYGFFYSYGSIVTCNSLTDATLNSDTYKVRCVRDATDDEIANATTTN